MKTRLILAAVFVLAVVGAGIFTKPPVGGEHATAPTQTTTVLTKTLEDKRRDCTTSGVDLGAIHANLFAVRDEKLLGQGDITADGKLVGSWSKWRVESSTQGGFPIIKDWTVVMENDGAACRVLKLE